eukprot:scaffold4048_cov191-Alexandrium_tamarense.AAC.5
MSSNNDGTPRKYHDKEAFVTGHSGTTAHEILLLCLVVPIGLHFYNKLHTLAGRSHVTSSVWVGIAIEFMTLMVPMLLMQTELLPYVRGPLILLMEMLIFASVVPNNTTPTQDDDNNRRPAFLSIHRSSVYILTTIAILAVDFPIFPRRFCKTEVGGYGWMDLGAASFIIIAGLTSAASSSSYGDASTSNQTSVKSIASWKRAMKKCTPLIVIGFVRLTTNKGLEYQEHVSEYGVHWNFFFTLCFVEGFMVLWRSRKNSLGSTFSSIPFDGVVAIMLMIPYQIYLSGGGQDFIENGDRKCSSDTSWLSSLPNICNIFAANREGILGVVGYWSLRLLSEEVGRYCLGCKSSLKQQRLITTSIALWTVHLTMVIGLGITNSRRSTNFPFIIWALAHNITILCLIRFVVTADGMTDVPHILNVVNRFGLVVFLTSNIFTGLVNLSVDTLHSSNGKSLAVLSVYLASVCGIALLLERIAHKAKSD